MVRRSFLAAMLAATAAIVIAQPGSSARGREGGILRFSFSPALGLVFVDPALAVTQASSSLLDTTCARLYSQPDKPSPGSFRPEPEVAASHSVSRDFRTYTFKLRSGFRFSDGEPLRASAFARGINRVLQPVVRSPGAVFMQDIVGAENVLAGRAKTARGVEAHGNTLVVRFTRPAPDFIARTTLPFFCSVPPRLEVSAEGIGKFPSAGPYYVKEYRANQRIIIRRNPFYGGKRKVYLQGFDVNLQGGNRLELLRSIERGDADWGYMLGGVYMDPSLNLVKKYGINKQRFFVKPGFTLRLLAFNSSRPLFRNNPRLRRAINFALDRRELEAIYGPVVSAATDQFLPPGMPGFRDAHIYPLGGPNLAKARKLANGRRRTGKAVFAFEPAFPPLMATAQLIKKQLAKIGLEITFKPVPQQGALTYLTSPGADWDIAFVLWDPSIPDAHASLNLLMETQLQGGETLTRVRSRLARAALIRAARLPRGRARNLAYAEVDAMITRDIAPVAALSVLNEATLVSERVGCRVFRPVLDLAVACLRR